MAGSNDDAPALVALRSLASDELLRFLARQRWFAIKGASPSSARVLDAVVLPWGDGDFAIARIGVQAGGVEHVYQLPFTSRTPENPDATADDAFRRGLIDAIALGAS